jgi:uncharacterized protein
MTDLTYRSPKTEVRESPIAGRGLFAKAAIAKGEIVAVKGGHVLTRAAWTVLERELGQVVLVAMRNIAPGEELTHDWATTDDGDYEMECRCGSPRCRRIITGKDWMRPELQERYRGWFCWFLQRKIDAGIR